MTNNNINKYKVILVITVGMGLLSLLFSSKILLYIGLGAGVLSLVSEKLAGIYQYSHPAQPGLFRFPFTYISAFKNVFEERGDQKA